MQGEYKVGVAIETTYQAVNNATGKTIQFDVYDEAHALDAIKSGTMTEIGVTGRYWYSFTPDAEGIWNTIMVNTTDSNGPVVKQYAVAGHSIDSIGDAVAALNDFDPAGDDVALVTVTSTVTDGAKEATVAKELTVDAIQTDLDNGTDGLGAIKGAVDQNTTDIGLVQTDTTAIIADLDNGTDGLGAIKNAIDNLGVPAMVG